MDNPPPVKVAKEYAEADDSTKVKKRLKTLNSTYGKPATKEAVAANANEWMAQNAKLKAMRAGKK